MAAASKSLKESSKYLACYVQSQYLMAKICIINIAQGERSSGLLLRCGSCALAQPYDSPERRPEERMTSQTCCKHPTQEFFEASILFAEALNSVYIV